jgi:hypothetical protein
MTLWMEWDFEPKRNRLVDPRQGRLSRSSVFCCLLSAQLHKGQSGSCRAGEVLVGSGVESFELVKKHCSSEVAYLALRLVLLCSEKTITGRGLDNRPQEARSISEAEGLLTTWHLFCDLGRMPRRVRGHDRIARLVGLSTPATATRGVLHHVTHVYQPIAWAHCSRLWCTSPPCIIKLPVRPQPEGAMGQGFSVM